MLSKRLDGFLEEETHPGGGKVEFREYGVVLFHAFANFGVQLGESILRTLVFVFIVIVFRIRERALSRSAQTTRPSADAQENEEIRRTHFQTHLARKHSQIADIA